MSYAPWQMVSELVLLTNLNWSIHSPIYLELIKAKAVGL